MCTKKSTPEIKKNLFVFLRKKIKKDIIISKIKIRWDGCKGEYIIMSKMKKRSRVRRNKSYLQTHKRSVLAISAVIVLLIAVVSVNAMTLRAKEKAYRAQETELEEQLKEEEERAAEIDDLESYVNTDEYVEEVAREKLGLVHENEIIFKGK